MKQRGAHNIENKRHGKREHLMLVMIADVDAGLKRHEPHPKKFFGCVKCAV